MSDQAGALDRQIDCTQFLLRALNRKPFQGCVNVLARVSPKLRAQIFQVNPFIFWIFCQGFLISADDVSIYGCASCLLCAFIEDLATWAESITEDNPPAMRYQIAAFDLLRFASALRHLLSATEWKPIDEQVKDGNPWLFYRDGEQFVARWYKNSREWGISAPVDEGEVRVWQSIGPRTFAGQIVFDGPTHVKPLPLPPSPLIEGE
jgi:hypothetical protein